MVVKSTSGYRRHFLLILRTRGLIVRLVDAHNFKKTPGCPTADKLDAVWLAEPNECGVLRPNFVFSTETRQQCDYTRVRADLVKDRMRRKQRVEKLL